MRGPEPNLSRRRSKRGRERANNILNLLIVVVVMLIIFTAAKIFIGNNNDGEATDDDSGIVTNKDPKDNNGSLNEDDKEDEGGTDPDDAESTSGKEEEDSDTSSNGNSDGQDENSNDESDGDANNGSETVIKNPSTEPHILETIVNPAWKPIGTTQTGAHISSYEKESVDWNEKVEAIAYASGLTNDNMIIWIIKNGGSAQKSIGVVSSLDKTNMYQVYLEWIEGQGWKPVKMDILTTLNFNY